MSDMDGLFDLPGVESRPAKPVGPPPIRGDQIAELRSAFEAAGITDQNERQAIVQSAVTRPVEALRDLKATDVRHVLARILSRASAASQGTGSAWDQRGEDTWIDRL